MRNTAASVGGIGPYGLAVGLWLSALSAEAGAQLFDNSPIPRPPGDVAAPRPPGDVPVPAPQAPVQQAPVQNVAPPASTGSIPRGGQTLQSLPPTPVSPPGLQSGQVALAVSARFGRDMPIITGGLHWRIYPARPEQGAFRPVKEDRGATPTFALPAGSYVVHVGFGLASATKPV